MNFSPYSNLNNQTNTDPTTKNLFVNEQPRSQYKIYRISNLKNVPPTSELYPLSRTESQSPPDFTYQTDELTINNINNHNQQTSDNNVKNFDIYSFASDSQFMHYQSSYNNLLNYQQKAKIPRSDSLISLSSQVDLASIENKIFSPLENTFTVTR